MEPYALLLLALRGRDWSLRHKSELRLKWTPKSRPKVAVVKIGVEGGPGGRLDNC